jgi:hypothetical protein
MQQEISDRMQTEGVGRALGLGTIERQRRA